MNENVNTIKETFKYGTRIELINMDDIQAPPAGTQGTVLYVDDMGTVHVKWDNGSSLGLAVDKDEFMVLTEE